MTDCWTCGNTGEVVREVEDDCPTCGGSGEIDDHQWSYAPDSAHLGHRPGRVSCPRCNRSGVLRQPRRITCDVCHGQSRERAIQRGMQQGHDIAEEIFEPRAGPVVIADPPREENSGLATLLGLAIWAAGGWLAWSLYQAWPGPSPEFRYAYGIALGLHLLAWLPLAWLRERLDDSPIPGLRALVFAGSAVPAAGGSLVAATWLEGGYVATGVAVFCGCLALALAAYAFSRMLAWFHVAFVPLLLALGFALSGPGGALEQLDCVASADVRANAVLPRTQDRRCVLLGQSTVSQWSRGALTIESPGARSDRTLPALVAVFAALLAAASMVVIVPLAAIRMLRNRGSYDRPNVSVGAHLFATALLCAALAFAAPDRIAAKTSLRPTMGNAPGLLMAPPLQLASRAWPQIQRSAPPPPLKPATSPRNKRSGRS